MISISDINQISTLLNGEKIIKYKLISNSFNINCVKLYLSNKQILIAKYYSKKNKEFNAILSEKKNLKYLAEKNINYFPKIIFGNEKYLITEYIENNNKKPKKTNLDFLNERKYKIKVNKVKKFFFKNVLPKPVIVFITLYFKKNTAKLPKILGFIVKFKIILGLIFLVIE